MRKLIPLLEACDFTMGQSPSSDTYNNCREGLPFYQGNADCRKRSPVPRVWRSAPRKTAGEGDILRFRRPELEQRGTGRAFKAVGKKVFAEMVLPIVSLEEQAGFAGRLSGFVELKECVLPQKNGSDDLFKTRYSLGVAA